jgi:hypothetical protein
MEIIYVTNKFSNRSGGRWSGFMVD